MKRPETFIVVIALWMIMHTGVVFSETVPSAESILDEAIELVTSSAKVEDGHSLLDVAERQAKVRSCEKAKALFNTAIDLNERWAKEQRGGLRVENHIGF